MSCAGSGLCGLRIGLCLRCLDISRPGTLVERLAQEIGGAKLHRFDGRNPITRWFGKQYSAIQAE